MTIATLQWRILRLLEQIGRELDSAEIAIEANVEVGDLLPALVRLEFQQFVDSAWETKTKPRQVTKRRLYWLTDAGRQSLAMKETA